MNVTDLIEQHLAKHPFTLITTHNEETAYTYSIGMTKYNLPDVVLTSIEPNNAEKILSYALHHLIEIESAEIGKAYHGVFENMPFMLMPVDTQLDGNDLFFQKHQFDEYKFKKHTDVLTLILPDQNGRFPRQEGVDPDWADKITRFTIKLQ